MMPHQQYPIPGAVPLPDDFALMSFPPPPPAAPALMPLVGMNNGPGTCTSSDAETPPPTLSFVPDVEFIPSSVVPVPDVGSVAVDPAAVKRHQAELLNLFAQPSPSPTPSHPTQPHALVLEHSGSGTDTSANLSGHTQVLSPAPTHVQTQSQVKPSSTQQQKAQDPRSSWGVALAKLNAGRIAAALWEQEVAEKRPEFGKSADKESRRKETNQKSAKVSRLRMRAYVKELEDVLEEGEVSTQNLKREVEQVEDEQNVLAAQIAFLRAQLAEANQVA